MLYAINAAIDTIPSTVNTPLVGTVTTDTANSKVLLYRGSNDVGSVYNQGRVSIVDSPMWIYVPGISPFLARVVGCYHSVIDPIVANNVWAITLDRPLPGCVANACKYLQGPAWYSLSNDGGGNASVFDGELGSTLVTVPAGETISPKGYQLNVTRIKLYAPVYIDASATTVKVELQI